MDDPIEPTPEAERAAMWTYIGVMVGFKIVTAGFILYYTHAYSAVIILIAMHIPWFVAGLALLSAPGAFWYRRLKARARRAELMRQEFSAEPSPAFSHLRLE